jgi:hypothetical protein
MWVFTGILQLKCVARTFKGPRFLGTFLLALPDATAPLKVFPITTARTKQLWPYDRHMNRSALFGHQFAHQAYQWPATHNAILARSCGAITARQFSGTSD